MEALNVPKWEKAIEVEFQTLLQNGTWEYVKHPKEKTTICCKWIFRIKSNIDKTLDKYKAYLVSKSFLQMSSVEFF